MKPVIGTVFSILILITGFSQIPFFPYQMLFYFFQESSYQSFSLLPSGIGLDSMKHLFLKKKISKKCMHCTALETNSYHNVIEANNGRLLVPTSLANIDFLSAKKGGKRKLGKVGKKVVLLFLYEATHRWLIGTLY